MASTSISIKNANQYTHGVAVKILRRCADDLAVVQKEQVAESFRIGGQPGEKWKPLWADKFVGTISEKKALALGKAKIAFSKFNRNGKASEQAILNARAKLDRAIAKGTAAVSYRKDGQPLMDKGALAASFFTKYNFVFEGELALLVVIASSNFTAKWHQVGFKTRGPNFIPLTLAAARNHVKGADPKLEGMEYGVDYIMAWKGVNVPARPMIDYNDAANKAQINDTIKSAMKRG